MSSKCQGKDRGRSQEDGRVKQMWAKAIGIEGIGYSPPHKLLDSQTLSGIQAHASTYKLHKTKPRNRYELACKLQILIQADIGWQAMAKHASVLRPCSHRGNILPGLTIYMKYILMTYVSICINTYIHIYIIPPYMHVWAYTHTSIISRLILHISVI